MVIQINETQIALRVHVHPHGLGYRSAETGAKPSRANNLMPPALRSCAGLPIRHDRITETSIPRGVTSLQVARAAKSRPPVQDSMVIECHQIARGTADAPFEARISERLGKEPVSAIVTGYAALRKADR